MRASKMPPRRAEGAGSCGKSRTLLAISDGHGAAVQGAANATKPTTVAADEGLALAKMSNSPVACKAGPPTRARSCRIVDIDSICLDANLSDDFKWPNEKMRSKGGLSEWPLWGWLGALHGRTGKVVYMWDRKPREGREKAAAVPKKCCKGSRQAGFRLKDAECDAMEKTMLLLEIDQHFIPILEEGIVDCSDTKSQWDEAEMCIFVERWVDQAVNEYHIPVHLLAQRAQVSHAEMWEWHKHVTDTVGQRRVKDGREANADSQTALVPAKQSPVTMKIYQFLLRDMSCEVCSGRLCRCCFSFCGVCEQLHCKTCSADCVRCEDCLAFFDTADWCAECGDDFCGCARDVLHCDNCKETLCSKCASIFPCFNCRKGYCLIKSEGDDEITGCAIRQSLWMCPDCRSVGYCKSPPQDHQAAGGQSGVHSSCMEHGSIECEVCKLRVCLSCANSSVTSPAGASCCLRCGAQRSARMKQVIKLKLKRIEEGCRCKQCMQRKLEKKAGGAKSKRIPVADDTYYAADGIGGASRPVEGKKAQEASDKSKAADAKAKADAAAKAFKELMQMEEKEEEKKKDEEPIVGPMLNVCVLSKEGSVSKRGPGAKTDVFTGSLSFGWTEGKGARRVQVRLDGNEQRFLKIPDSANCVTLADLVLPVGEHVASLRVARAKGPWCAWSAEIKFELADMGGSSQGASASEGSQGGVVAATAPQQPNPTVATLGAEAGAQTGARSAQKEPPDAQKAAPGVAATGAGTRASGKDGKQQPADMSKPKDKAASSRAAPKQASNSNGDGARAAASDPADGKSAAKGKCVESGKSQKDNKDQLLTNQDGNAASGHLKSNTAVGSAGADKLRASANSSKAASVHSHKKDSKAASKREGSAANGGVAGKVAAAVGKEARAASSSESEDQGDGEDEDEDALMRLAALSVSNRSGTAKKKDAGQKGMALLGGESGARKDDAQQTTNRSAHQHTTPHQNTNTQGQPYGGGTAERHPQVGGSGGGGGGGGSPGTQQKSAAEPTAQQQQQMAHLAHLHGHIVMSCNIEAKERGSIIGDGGARIKELKRRWPRVFIYVEKDNTLTVRGSVQEEVDACFFLALFFKDKPKTWEVESWCRCGKCCTEDGCAVMRHVKQQRNPLPPPHHQTQQQVQKQVQKQVQVQQQQHAPLANERQPAPRPPAVFNGPGPGVPNRGVGGVQLNREDHGDDANEARECEICFEREADTRLKPCGHVMCQECFQSVRKASILLPQSGMGCPFCRCVVKSHSSTNTSGRELSKTAHSATGWPSRDTMATNGRLAEDPLNFTDMSMGEHRWFGDIALEVARAGMGAEMEAESLDGGFETGFAGRAEGGPPQGPDAGFDQRTPLAGYGLSHVTHVGVPLETSLHQHRQDTQGRGHQGWAVGEAGWNPKRLEQEHFQHQQQQLQYYGVQYQQPHGQQTFGNGSLQWLGGHESPADTDVAAGSLHMRSQVVGSMRQSDIGLGGLQYLNSGLPVINGGGRPSWTDAQGQYGGIGGGKHDEQREMLPQQAGVPSQGEDDGTSNILKMMFGVALS